MEKTKAINLLKAIAFLLIIFIVLYYVLNTVLIKRNSFAPRRMQDIENAEVISVGSSHVHASISSLDLWKDYGLIAQNVTKGGSTIVENYFLIKNILDKKKPKLIVMESFLVGKDMAYSVATCEANLLGAKVTLPRGLVSYDMVQNFLENQKGEKKYALEHYVFPEIVYHSSWAELKKSNLIDTQGYRNGLLISHSIYKNKDIVSENKVPEIQGDFLDPVQMEYLIKTIELCKSENVQLVLTVVPYTVDKYRTTKNHWKETVQAYRDLAKIAEQYDVPYINYFDLVDDIGINFETDFRDIDHLNYYGAEKITAHLGQYLVDNYDLTDRRKDPAYAYMWDNYIEFVHQRNNSELPKLTDAEKYFDILRSDEEYIVSTSLRQKPKAKVKIPEAIAVQFKKIGVNMGKFGTGGGYISLVSNGDMWYEANEPDYATLIDYKKFEMSSSTTKVSIKVGGVESSKNKYGLNVTVYDPVTERVIDSVTVDIYNDCNMVRK